MKQAMFDFFERYLRKHQEEYNELPIAIQRKQVDPTFYQGVFEDDWSFWKPKEKTDTTDLDKLEADLELKFHPSIKAYFNSYWFAELAGCIGESRVDLYPVLPDSELDPFASRVKAYVKNKGHKRWIPIGMESEQDLLVVIDNESGAVLIDDHDREEMIPLAENLPALIASLN